MFPSTTASRSFARLGARRREGRWRGIMRRSLSAVTRRLRGASDASRPPTRVAALADASSAVAISQPCAPSRASSPPRPPHAPPSPRSPSRTPFPTSTPPSVASFTPTAPATSPRRPSASSASTSSVAPSVARAPAASHRARADHLPGQRRVPPPPPPRRGTPSAPDGTRRHPREDGNPRATPQRPFRRLRRRRRARRRRRRPRRLPVFAPRRPRGDGVEKPPRRARRESNSRPRSRSASRPRPSDGARLLQPRGGFRNRHPGCGDWRRRSGSPWRRTPRRSAAIGARTRSIRARLYAADDAVVSLWIARRQHARDAPGDVSFADWSSCFAGCSRPEDLDARAADVAAEIVPAPETMRAQFRRFANRRRAARATREAADRFIRIAQTLARHDARGGDAPGAATMTLREVIRLGAGVGRPTSETTKAPVGVPTKRRLGGERGVERRIERRVSRESPFPTRWSSALPRWSSASSAPSFTFRETGARARFGQR